MITRFQICFYTRRLFNTALEKLCDLISVMDRVRLRLLWGPISNEEEGGNIYIWDLGPLNGGGTRL